MRIRSYFVAMFIAGLLFGRIDMVHGQDYPSKPIRLVTGGAGGTSDFVARVLAQGFTTALGQAVVVNYPSGNIPGQTVAKATPDGYTLLVAGATVWIGPLLQKEVPYDPEKDFLPVSLAVREPAVLVVHPSLPVHSAKELIALAKARPGELNYASGQAGSQSQLAMELFKYMAGVNIQGIPYANGSIRIAELLGGQTQIEIDNAVVVTPHVKTGRLRALAVAGLQSSPLLPGLPTISATGVPGYESIGRTALFAPAKTPDVIIVRLNQEVVRFLDLPGTKARLLEYGQEAAGSSPQELAAIVRAERERLGKVIKASGIRGQ